MKNWFRTWKLLHCLFILLMGFSQQEYWSGLPFPLTVDHILSELSTMTCLGWPCTAWLIASLSYESPFATTRLQSVKGVKFLMYLKIYTSNYFPPIFFQAISIRLIETKINDLSIQLEQVKCLVLDLLPTNKT